MWLAQTILVLILALVASLITLRMDKKDAATEGSVLSRTQPISSGKLNDFIGEIAKELQEPYSLVALRRQNLLYYRSIFSKSAFPHLLSQLHPLISPFTCYCPTLSRFTRLSIYLLQVNLVSGLGFGYFVGVYRKNENSERDVQLIDQADILTVLISTVIASVLLTPWLSEPLIKICSDKLESSARQSAESSIIEPV